MNCFNHPDRSAVGICKSCQRGLCHDCTADLGKGLACKDRCEEDVRQLNMMVEQSIRLRPTSTFYLARARHTRIAGSIFYIVMGVGFVYWGYSRPFLHFVAVLGVLFIIYGGYFLSQLPKKADLSDSDGSKPQSP